VNNYRNWRNRGEGANTIDAVFLLDSRDNLIELRVKQQLSAKLLSPELRAEDGKALESRGRDLLLSAGGRVMRY